MNPDELKEYALAYLHCENCKSNQISFIENTPNLDINCGNCNSVNMIILHLYTVTELIDIAQKQIMSGNPANNYAIWKMSSPTELPTGLEFIEDLDKEKDE